MNEFLAMGGSGFYIWGSYGMAALLVALEIVFVRARKRAADTAAEAATPDLQPPIALDRPRAP
jgi:heme exporter protein CcmD